MNTSDPTNAQFAAYRAMWAYFNAVLFGGSLGDVIRVPRNLPRRAVWPPMRRIRRWTAAIPDAACVVAG